MFDSIFSLFGYVDTQDEKEAEGTMQAMADAADDGDEEAKEDLRDWVDRRNDNGFNVFNPMSWFN